MKLLQRGVALALLTTFTLASETALAYEQDKTYKITVLHTNDHHGHFWRNEYGEYGLAAQKTLVDGIRKEVAAEGGSVLLLSGGDINTGVPESDLQDAEPDFRGMNLVGYDAMAIGNHEFDNPLTVLRQQEKWAKFPLLSANIYQKSTGERLFKPWALFKRQDLKIAVIGLTTDDTAKIGNPEYFTDIEFRKPADEAKLVIQELQQTEKPDIIIAATYMGRLILAAQMDRTGADFAVMSGGGIRDSIEAGDISYKNVLKVQPFGNVVVYADMTGKEVIDYLTAVAQMKPDSGAYPQFANVSFVAKDGKLNDLKIKGEPVDPAKTYRMATLNFNATGGDGYPRLDNKPGYVNTGFIDAEVLKAYIQKSSPLDVSVYEPKGEVSWQ
ncbi:bifunctional UDP-sugar hydrolase/5'-nucleotidase [Escherichia coli]|uniref:bifunctional UDP-sugar hydrolase/5'-nucleotidase n=1 Tax=Escherichia coli TaxID=562 RepID=UPI002A089FDF|nr:bifunctional UDP-sugar hydrolase/5'-nucleotidase [Escherichia coli]MDN0525333.1 bifunctional UDP-sugar hydrolase/5'-nucleotidase [Escherichia coli]MDN0576804.1 bifunctional UDP-sugar hydrolase/5'-nucleotidase [Escherichia coli]